MSDTVVVVGGGIAGVQASLDLAESGAKVVLVERSPSIGGKMAALDKNFPTLDCSICIEAPKLSEVAEHPNVEVLALAEIERVEGEAGDFTVTIRQRERFVTDECTRCNLCTLACPVALPSEFDAAMATRRAIYTPFPQAVPGPYLVDLEHCLNDPPNYLPCSRCVDACPPKCIDFNLPRERLVERRAAAVIAATGFETFDATRMAEFGYGTHPDILTALEFERLLNAAGPTGGHLIRPSDGREPENVFFVLCVGSRDRRFYRYCSRFCCMYSAKHAFQALDHGVKNVTVLYMDVRAYGKGFDEFWDRVRAEGARLVRGRPARIVPNERGLVVRYEDTDQGRIEEAHADLVVLATAARPPDGLADLARRLGVDVGADGFLKTFETAVGPVATTRPGIYVCGAATGPKDIPDSVAEGSAAAAAALEHVRERSWPTEPEPEPRPAGEEAKIGVFLCDCGSNIAGVVDMQRALDFSARLPGVAHAEEVMFACAGNTQGEIARTIREKGLNRLVVAACSPKTHEGTFRRVCLKAGLNPYLLDMVNVRNQDSWVHKGERDAATEKAFDMVRMGVEKARRLEELHTLEQPMVQAALVIGGGVAGMAAAANLARRGIETHLVEREPELGGNLRHLAHVAPLDLDAAELLAARRAEVEASGAIVHLGDEVELIDGHIGDFHARLRSGAEIRAGAVILATGAAPYQPTEFGWGRRLDALTNLELEACEDEVVADSGRRNVTFVACVGSRRDGRGCSRYCCTAMIGQALRLKRAGKNVRILYRDIRTFNRHGEELYEQAQREGVEFFRFDPERPPEEVLRVDDGAVELYDHLLGAPVRIPTDLLVLVVGLVPREESVFQQLKVARSQDGFLLERHPKLGPVEAGSPGIFLAGAAQAPKDLADSVAQGLAAAAKAGLLLARDTIEKEPIVAQIDADACTGCTLCVRVCPFGAIEMTPPYEGKPKGIARVITAACQGCGTCSAACNFDAIEMPYFTDEQILAQIDAALVERPAEKVIVFACNWCSYAGADQAGVEKLQYPPSARIIRSMCSGRLRERFIARAFERGAGAVLVTGCRIGDCHYINANHHTLKRFEHWKKKYTTQKGLAPERLQLQWVSASEGKLFASKMREMDAVAREYARSVEREGEPAHA